MWRGTDKNASGMSGPVIDADFLIIGGGIAAVTAAQTLRHEGEMGSIILLAAEPVLPYNRPLLTKSILTGKLEPEQILLHPPARYGADDIVVRPNISARSVHPSDAAPHEPAHRPATGRARPSTGALAATRGPRDAVAGAGGRRLEHLGDAAGAG